MKHKVKAHTLAAFQTLIQETRNQLDLSGEEIKRTKINMLYDNSWRDSFSAVIWTEPRGQEDR
jgi:hypothetical protein